MLVSIRAIYNWDSTIFDDFVIPSEMDKPTLIGLIMKELAELSIVYSDPVTLKTYINLWSVTRNRVWEKLWDLATEEYDPLDNYNRTDTITTVHGHKLTVNKADTITTAHGHKLTIDRTNTKNDTQYGTGNGSIAESNYVYGFNSESRTHEHDTDTSSTNNYSDTMNGNEYGQDVQTNSGTDTETQYGEDVHTNSGTDTETRHGEGNIGVTTYGKMIGEELELRPKLDIYRYIVEEFKHEFCVMIY